MTGVRADARRWPAAVFALVGCSYILAILAGNAMRDLNSGVSLLWLPNAVLVGALVFSDPPIWACIVLAGLLGELAGDWLIGIPPDDALPLGLVNLVESLLVAIAWRRMDRASWPLETVRSVLALTVATIATTAVTAFPGTIAAVNAFGGVGWRVYLSWWLGDSLGMLVGVPVVVSAVGLAVHRCGAEFRRLGLMGLAGAVFGLAASKLANSSGPAAAAFVVIAVAIALTMWDGTTGAALGGLLLAVVSGDTLAPLDDSGPVAAQLFVIPVVVALLLMGAQEVTMRQQAAALAEARARVEALAVRDALTGLLNLRGLQVQGSEAIATAAAADTCLGVLYGDMDQLKRINDTLGHSVGSQALVEVANVMRACFRGSDLLARVGGDEFVVIFPAVDEPAVTAAQDRFVQRLAAADRTKANPDYRLSMSCGSVLARPQDLSYGPPTEVLDSLLSQADRRMYQGKTRR